MPSSLQKIIGFSPEASEHITYVKEGATGTTANQFAYGDPLKFSGTDVAVCYLDKSQTSSGSGSSPAGFVGIALRDHKGAAGSTYDLPVMKVEAGVRLFLPVYSATPADAVYSNVHVGDKMRIVAINGIFAADIDNTTNPVLQLDEKIPGTPDDEKYAGAWFKVISSVSAF